MVPRYPNAWDHFIMASIEHVVKVSLICHRINRSPTVCFQCVKEFPNEGCLVIKVSTLQVVKESNYTYCMLSRIHTTCCQDVKASSFACCYGDKNSRYQYCMLPKCQGSLLHVLKVSRL